ncbi:MAG: glycerate kinase [Clostridia bacterium]
MKHIIVAMDSFKGSLTSQKACEIVGKALEKVATKVTLIPIADGGEGTAEAFLCAIGGERHYLWVTGPNGQQVEAYFIVLADGTAVIEMAQASGLSLAREKNPLITTTFGTGELIKAALALKCPRIIVGIGGSATNDGGIGMAAALGASFLDKQGQEIKHTGGGLADLVAIDITGIDQRLAKTEIVVACDVNSPFYGPKGASVVYGPQKGADVTMVASLDANLQNLARIITQKLDINLQELPGSGAAGGLGGGLVAFAGAKLSSGITILLDTVGFKQKLEDCDLVITGEGSFDQQSLHGKVISGIAKLTKARHVPLIVLTGAVQLGRAEYEELGVTAVFSTNPRPCSIAQAKTEIVENLQQLSENLAVTLQIT